MTPKMAAPRRLRTETPTEEARRVANFFLTLLPADEQARQTQRAHAGGYSWIGAAVVHVTGDDILMPSDAARLVHATADILRGWVRLGVLERTGRGYLVKDVYAAKATIVERRATRHVRSG
jgi:hypothetical protein